MTSPFSRIIAKYLPTPQNRKKHRLQCLKSKNKLEENQSIQIGCKIEKLYDFYSSKNYLQVSIFIGNKTSKPIDNYKIEFKGTTNLSVFMQEKSDRLIKGDTQVKQRLILQLVQQQGQEFSSEILLTMSFTSPIFTLKDTLIPLSLWSFYNFPSQMQKLISPSITKNTFLQLMKQNYELMEQQEVLMNTGLFKKGYSDKEMDKLLEKPIRIQNSQQNERGIVYAGVFTMKNLMEEMAMLVQVNCGSQEELRMKVTLAGNQYTYFEAIFENVNFLFAK